MIPPDTCCLQGHKAWRRVRDLLVRRRIAIKKKLQRRGANTRNCIVIGALSPAQFLFGCYDLSKTSSDIFCMPKFLTVFIAAENQECSYSPLRNLCYFSKR